MKEMMKKITAALVLSLGLALGAQAGDKVYYLHRYWDSTAGKVVTETKSTTTYKVIDGSDYTLGDDADAYDASAGIYCYVVNADDVVISENITVQNNVLLITLCDLNWDVWGYMSAAGGIFVTSGSALTLATGSVDETFGEGGGVYAVGGESGGAGIGGEAGSSVTINGGQYELVGANGAAGIGGANGGSGPNITINSGYVSATAGSGAAAIGGGNGGGGASITINDGEITASGSDVGIGDGNGGSGSNTTINGGEITVNCTVGIQSSGAVVIGGGDVSVTGTAGPGISSGSVEITGGTLHVNGSTTGIQSSGAATISGGVVNATGSAGAGISAGTAEITGGKVLATGSTIGIQTSGALAIGNAGVTALGTTGEGISASAVSVTDNAGIAASGTIGVLSSGTVGVSNAGVSARGTAGAGISAANGTAISGKATLLAEGSTAAFSGDVTVTDPESGYYNVLSGAGLTSDFLSSSTIQAYTSGTAFGLSEKGVAILPKTLSYRNYNAQGQYTGDVELNYRTAGTATLVLASDTTWDNASTMYVSLGGLLEQTVTVDGAVKLLLVDRSNLSVMGTAATAASAHAGICVHNDTPSSTAANTFTVYAQSVGEGMGRLFAFGTTYNHGAARFNSGAGIGGNGVSSDKTKNSGSNITINGGNVTATSGGYYAAGIGGGCYCTDGWSDYYGGGGSFITINGGMVTTVGGCSAASIGGGFYNNGTNITINGGTVIANGGANGVGIGGGKNGNGSHITISGGTVTATGYGSGAGIGGGEHVVYGGDCFDVTISGGTVTAVGGAYAAGIGGGYGGSVSNITISGGTVTATGGASGIAGIGIGYEGAAAANICIGTILTVRASNVNNPPQAADKISDGVKTDFTADLSGKRYATVTMPAVAYRNYADGAFADASVGGEAGPVYAFINGDNLPTSWNAGYYVVGDDYNHDGVIDATDATLGANTFTISETVSTVGDVKLILVDGFTLNVTPTAYGAYAISGENSGATFTVYAQSTGDGAGVLNVTGMNSASDAGKGGKGISMWDGVTINGGSVTCTGGQGWQSGFQGGAGGNGIYSFKGNVTLNGGKVTATGGSGGSGAIGISGCGVVINGDTVYARGGTGMFGPADGIYASDATTITIARGLVVRADVSTNPPETVVSDGTKTDFTSVLSDKRYVSVELPFLAFTAESGKVTLSATKNWDGTMYASTNGVDWFVWEGESIVSQDSTIKVYGIGNTVVSKGSAWSLTGTKISAEGDIAVLLDRGKYARGVEPPAGEKAFWKLFYECWSLVKAPTLSLKTAQFCMYDSMFAACTSLPQAPEIALTNTAGSVCGSMFQSCLAMTNGPSVLPAADASLYQCYSSMFAGCVKLEKTPLLPATNVGSCAYTEMFGRCTSLKRLPVLAATNLLDNAYSFMFQNCHFKLYSMGVGESWSIPAEVTFPWDQCMFQTSDPSTQSVPAGCPIPGVKYYYEPWPTFALTVPELTSATVALSYGDDFPNPGESIGFAAGTYDVYSNYTVRVVYTAQHGYYFAGDVSCVTQSVVLTTGAKTIEQAAPKAHEHGGIVYTERLDDATLAACYTNAFAELNDDPYYLLPAGNYFVPTNLLLKAPLYVGSGTNVNICLNGKVVAQNRNNYYLNQLLYVVGTVHLDDCGTEEHLFVAENDSENDRWVLVGSADHWRHENWSDYVLTNKVVGGCIADVTGYGVLVVDGGAFAMSAGNIVGNSNAGILVKFSTFDFTGGSILGNSCGGVDVYGSTCDMSGTARIAYNRSTGWGGGVSVSDQNGVGSVFTMTGGSIDHNRAADGGAGINNNSTIKLLGGSVCSNRIVEVLVPMLMLGADNGAGVLADIIGHNVTNVIGGTVRIFDNVNVKNGNIADNVMLADGNVITLENPAADMDIGVDTETTDDSEPKPLRITSSNGATDCHQYFHADNPRYYVINNSDDPAAQYAMLADRIVEQPTSFNDFTFVIDTNGLDGTFTYSWSQMVPQPTPATSADFECFYCGSFDGTTMTSESNSWYPEQAIDTYACFEGIAAGDGVSFKASVSDLVCGSDESGALTYDSATDRWTYTFTYASDWGNSMMHLKSPSATDPFTLTDIKVIKPVAQTIAGEVSAQLSLDKQTNGETYYATFTFTPSDPAKQSAFTLTSEKATRYHAHDEVLFYTPIATESELRSFLTGTDNGYLTADIAVTGEDPATVTSGVTNRLCLNGHIITRDCTSATNSVFLLKKNAMLAVYDCDDTEHYFAVDETTKRWIPTNAVTENVVKGGYICGGLHQGVYLYYPTYPEMQAGGVYSGFELHGGSLVGCSSGAIASGSHGKVLVTGGGVVGNTKLVYSFSEYQGKFVLADGLAAIDIVVSEFEMTGGEVRANYGSYGPGVRLAQATKAEITGGVFTENEATESPAIYCYSTDLVLGGDLLITNNTVGAYGAIYAEGGTLTMRDNVRVVGNVGASICGGVYCMPSYNQSTQTIILSNDVQIAGNAGSDLCLVRYGDNLPAVDLNGLSSGADITLAALNYDTESNNISIIPETAADSLVVATNVTEAAFAHLDASRADQYIELDAEGNLWLKARLISQPTGANAFTYELDETSYTGAAPDGSVAYQWYPAETETDVVTGDTPDRPTTLLGYETYATFDPATQTWSGEYDSDKGNIVFVGFNAKKGTEVSFAMKCSTNAFDGVIYGADMTICEIEVVGTEGDMYLCRGVAPTSAGCFIVGQTYDGETFTVSNLVATTQAIDYANPMAGQTAAAFDFSTIGTNECGGSFACVADFIANDGTTTNFTMTSDIVGFHLNRDEDGKAIGFFDTEITSLSDLEALCAAGGNGYLAANLALPSDTEIAVEANVKLCLNGHTFVCGEGAGFSGDVTLTFCDCGVGTSGLNLGNTEWAGYRLEGPGTFTDEVDPSILVTTNGFRAFDNGNSTWTAAKAWSVSFGLCDGTGAVVTNYVKRGAAIAKPSPDPTREGMAFDGWYTNSECTVAYDFATPVTGELTLYAKWATPGAAVENEDGDVVLAKDFTNAVEIAQNGGRVITTDETPIQVVNKELVISTENVSKLDGVTAGTTTAGAALAKTNSVGAEASLVVIGQVVGDRVTVIRDRKADVKEKEPATGVEEGDWAVLTNLATEVSQTGIYEALSEETKTNFVKKALAKDPSADAVIVTVNLDVTPVDVKKDDGGNYMKYTYDVQPVASIVAVKDGTFTNVVAEGIELKAGSDFIRDTWFKITLPCAGMMPVAVLHKLSDGSFDEYAKGSGGCPTGAGDAKTFAHDAVNQRVTFWVQENSEMSVLTVPATPMALAYDAMGGQFSDATVTKRITALNIDAYDFPAVTRAGYVFAGWYDGFTNGAPQVAAGTAITVTNLCAKWIKAGATPAGDTNVLTGTFASPYDGALFDVLPTNAYATGEIVFPDRWGDPTNGAAIVSITNRAFMLSRYQKKYAAPAITSVTLPAFLTAIKTYAFYGNTALTNVTFAPVYDYRTGAPATLSIENYAFANTAITNLVFPAGGSYRLGLHAFSENQNLKDVWILGEVTLDSLDNAPFFNIGRKCGGAVFHLSASAFANTNFVYALTNGLYRVKVAETDPVSSITNTPAGTVTTESFVVGTDDIVVTFTLSDDAPWREVTTETVSLLFSKNLDKLVAGQCEKIPAITVEKSAFGWKATFAKPDVDSAYFSVCVGK